MKVILQVNCLEATFFAVLVISLMLTLSGYVTPYWQTVEIPEISGQFLEVQVGLNYACNLEDGNKTQCKVLPFFYTNALESTPSATMFAVRMLITLHVVFMIIGVILNLLSTSCNGQPRKKKVVTRVISMLCSLLGISGLTLFAGALTRYRSPFDPLISLEDIGRLRPPVFHLSFYLCCAGCALFSLFTSAEMLISLKGMERESRDANAAKIQVGDNVCSIYDPESPQPIQRADSSAEWTLVESCHVEIFTNPWMKKY